MPYKRRSKEELNAIFKALDDRVPQKEIQREYDISDGSIARLMRVHRGLAPDASRKKIEDKVQKLENKLKERDREIALLKAALKKN